MHVGSCNVCLCSLSAQVLSASSNMVRVELDKVQGSGSGSADTSSTQQETHNASQPDLPRTELLCSLRTLLKKMNQTGLVGDRVVVTSVDWNLGRGQVGRTIRMTGDSQFYSLAAFQHAESMRLQRLCLHSLAIGYTA